VPAEHCFRHNAEQWKRRYRMGTSTISVQPLKPALTTTPDLSRRGPQWRL